MAHDLNCTAVRKHNRFWLAGAALTASALFLSGCSGSAGSASGNAAAGGGACNISADFPKGAIEVIVPFAAGGGTDSVGRMIAQQLAGRLGTQINVVNRTGGGGAVGNQALASAAPDGKTFGLVTAELSTLHHLGLTEVNPDDVTPISQFNADPAGITVAADAPYNNVKELLEYAKSNPGKLVASGTGHAGIWHVALVGMLLENGMAPDSIRWVPSAGSAPALQELVAGGVDISTASLAENNTMIESGRVKALGVMAPERIVDFPDVETLTEAGVNHTVESFRGLGAPAGIDGDIVKELECNLKEISESEEFVSFMKESGLGITYRNAADFKTFIKEDDVSKGEIIKKAGLDAQ